MLSSVIIIILATLIISMFFIFLFIFIQKSKVNTSSSKLINMTEITESKTQTKVPTPTTDSKTQTKVPTTESKTQTKVATPMPKPQNTVSADFSKNFSNRFILKTNLVPKNVSQAVHDLILEVYPKMVHDFPSLAVDDLKVIIDDNVDTQVAYTVGKTITINGQYLSKHPLDIDCVTHELFHAVQYSIFNSPPIWVNEGLADLARDKYGIHNKEAGWQLEAPTSKDKYTDGYRVTAAFFKYLNTIYPNFINSLYSTIESGKYTDSWWTSINGSSLEKLWQDYVSKNQGQKQQRVLVPPQYLQPH